MQLWNLHVKTIFRQRAIPLYTCSQTLFFVHLFNEDSSLKQTVCFVLGKESPYPYNYITSFNLLNMNTLLINTLSMAPSVSVLINRFDCTSKQGRGLHFMYFIALWSIESQKTSFHAILYILQYKLLSFIFHGFIFILEWVITWIITFIQNISLFLIG